MGEVGGLGRGEYFQPIKFMANHGSYGRVGGSYVGSLLYGGTGDRKK